MSLRSDLAYSASRWSAGFGLCFALMAGRAQAQPAEPPTPTAEQTTEAAAERQQPETTPALPSPQAPSPNPTDSRPAPRTSVAQPAAPAEPDRRSPPKPVQHKPARPAPPQSAAPAPEARTGGAEGPTASDTPADTDAPLDTQQPAPPLATADAAAPEPAPESESEPEAPASTTEQEQLREELERERRRRRELERELDSERDRMAPPAPGRDVFRAFNDWLWERVEAPSPPPPSDAPPSAPDAEPSPSSDTDELEFYLQQTLREWLGLVPRDRFSWFGLCFLLALAWTGLRFIQRIRQRFSPDGVIPSGLRAMTLTLRLTIFAIVLTLVARLMPSALRPGVLVAVLALCAAVGFGTAWLLLPDLLAGALLLVDSRVRRGEWIVGSGFSGHVERIGPTVTRFRSPQGSVLLVPNRLLARSPIQRGVRRGHFVEVEVRAPVDASSSMLRKAISESVLCSPYVPPDPQLTLTRDPQDPLRWHVRVRLTHARFAAVFQGELLERVEDSLRTSTHVTS